MFGKDKPSLGRIVHYVEADPRDGLRVGIITAVAPIPEGAADEGVVDLHVFVPQSVPGAGAPVQVRENVKNDEEEKKVGTWHWPVRS